MRTSDQHPRVSSTRITSHRVMPCHVIVSSRQANVDNRDHDQYFRVNHKYASFQMPVEENVKKKQSKNIDSNFIYRSCPRSFMNLGTIVKRSPCSRRPQHNIVILVLHVKPSVTHCALAVLHKEIREPLTWGISTLRARRDTCQSLSVFNSGSLFLKLLEFNRCYSYA